MLILIGNLCIVSACNVLEVEPVSSILSANFYKNAGDAEAALMSVYDGLQGAITQNWIAAPEAMSGAYQISGGNFTRHKDFVPTPGQGNIRDLWSVSYRTIQRANDVIENVPTISDPALDTDQVLGEAHFVRGLTFFHLTRLFGKIPLVTQTSKSPTQDYNVPRDEVSAVYDQIIDDLEKAETMLSATSTNRARASKGAAKALLARVYLFRQAPGDYALALAKTEEVIADPQYSLVSGANYASLFLAGEQNTSETIFEVSYRPNTAVEGQGLEREFVYYPGSTPRVRPNAALVTALTADPDDLRLPITLGYFNGNPYIKKYQTADPADAARGSQVPNVIMIRLADVILMHAESLNELGMTTDAIPFLNQIRARAGIDPTTAVTQAEVRLAIEQERHVELVAEGHRWFDLLRTGRAADVNPIYAAAMPGRELWPIPSREIDLNTNLLPQNESY